MLIVFAILIFIAAFFIIGYYEMPFFLDKSIQWQKKKAKESSIRLEDSFIFVAKRRMRLLYYLMPVILGVIGFIIFKFIGLIIGLVLGVIFPIVAVKFIIAKRRSQFEHQLIDTLMIISSSLKGGLSLIQSFEVIMEDMPPPTSDEFSLVVRETKVGVSLEESLVKLNKRMSSEDMNLVVSSILVARETGGDLTKVFSRLIQTIRDRMEIKDMANTLTLQGRIQGVIMSIIPVVFVVFILKFNPHHFDTMMHDEKGKMLLITAVVLQICAFFFIKKFSTVKV